MTARRALVEFVVAALALVALVSACGNDEHAPPPVASAPVTRTAP